MPDAAKPGGVGQTTSFMFIVVCCACLLLALVAVLQSYHELRHEVQSELSDQTTGQTTGAPLDKNAQATAESLKNLFDNLKDRTDNLQKLITTLIALSSLYAIVLTVTGYLNVQKVVLEAQTSLTEAQASLNELDAMKEAMEKEYGSLTHISENLEKVTKELRDQLPDVQELSSSFAELKPEEHEKVYFQEKAISFAQLVAPGPDKDADIAERLSGAFVTLARFYRGLYLSWKPGANQAQPQEPARIAGLRRRQREIQSRRY